MMKSDLKRYQENEKEQILAFKIEIFKRYKVELKSSLSKEELKKKKIIINIKVYERKTF